jgi:hypothetical protein
VGLKTLVLKPFIQTATYRNVVAPGTAVVNLIDDVRIFVYAAVANPKYSTVPAALGAHMVSEGVRSVR